MNKYVVRNTITNESETVYAENSMLAKKAVCRTYGWETIDCVVRMIG